MPESLPPLLLVGCGQMGGALLDAWMGKGLPPSIVLDRHRTSVPSPHRIARAVEDIPEAFRPSAIVLAVKPQTALNTIEALTKTRPHVADSAVILSVMAGTTTATISDAFRQGGHPSNPAIIRAMPNTPSAIGQGMTGLYGAIDIAPEARALCDRLLQAVGTTVWVEREDQINAVTAVSGSGPAYVFLLAELLERAGVEQGLPPATARLLARKTITGAGTLLDQVTEDASELRRRVTSPGGTTAQAIAVLNADDAWPCIVSGAIAAATRRARELAA